MIKLKNIIWKETESSLYADCMRYDAIIRDSQFLTIIEDKRYINDVVGTEPNLRSNSWYYIHTTSDIFKVRGNEGVTEWGWFKTLNECKMKAEEIISMEFESYIDMRDFKLNELL